MRQAGLTAAYLRMGRYDATRGTIGTFIGARVLGAMQDALRDADYVPRLVRAAESKLLRAESEAMRRTGDRASDEQLAEVLGVGVSEVWKLQSDAAVIGRVSLQSVISTHNRGRENETLVEVLEDHRSEDPTARARMTDQMRSLLRGLNKSERLILIGYYYDGQTMKEIGGQLGMSESRVSQIHSRLLLWLRKRLESQEATA